MKTLLKDEGVLPRGLSHPAVTGDKVWDEAILEGQLRWATRRVPLFHPPPPLPLAGIPVKYWEEGPHNKPK